MGNSINTVSLLHKRTKRDYIGRMMHDKSKCMEIARQYGYDYWDGDRRYGYGGYRYDGRWKIVAEKLIETYRLPNNARILDVGCGKGFLLYELKMLLPDAEIAGFDISKYAIENAKEEVKKSLFVHRAQDGFPFKNGEFDLVISITTLHNLCIGDLKSALKEIERVGRNKYVVVESYRNAEELFNLQCWALTCEAFFSPEEWRWLFDEFGYKGDHEFIYFE
ncbi:MAG: class I SAM-dependent methyltransferase [Candidatus Omnitrophica bacterium]|nr:class I SAM-dependent methyltransferase [Candidatus Omnitrophota bacterium]